MPVKKEIDEQRRVEPMVKRRIALIYVTALLFVGAMFAGLGDSEPRPMWCGHYELSALERINPARSKRHCYCPGFAAKRQLKHLHLAQRIYENEHDRFAISLNDLANDLMIDRRSPGELKLRSDGDRYYATIAMTNTIPGHLLLLDDGRIFFKNGGNAQVSDLCLQEARAPSN